MAATSQPAEAFISFITQLGLREEIGHTLWGGNIKSAQELAACSKDKLSGIVDDSLLLNYIHPVLTKFTFSIAIAPNPYDKALAIIRKAAENEETMGNQINFPQSDSPRFVSGRTDGPAVTQLDTLSTAAQSMQELKIKGEQSKFNVSGGNFVQSPLGVESGAKIDNQNSHIIFVSGNSKDAAKAQKTFETVDLNNLYFSNPAYNQRFTVGGWDIHLQENICGQRANDPTVYPLHNWGQSRALILNNTEFQGSMPTREGAETDSKNLEALLECMGFKVSSYTNKRKAEIFQILSEFTASRDNQNAPIILVFIGSHGQRAGNIDWFVGTDHNKISDEEVVKFFTYERSLINKRTPKLFFFQFCRQDHESQNRTQSDSIIELEKPRDFGWLEGKTAWDPATENPVTGSVYHPAQKWANMLFAYATAPGTRAFRDTKQGSWFVSTFCKVMKEHGYKEDLLTMLTMVNSAVMEKKGRENNQIAVQLSEFRSYLTKKVKFFN